MEDRRPAPWRWPRPLSRGRARHRASGGVAGGTADAGGVLSSPPGAGRPQAGGCLSACRASVPTAHSPTGLEASRQSGCRARRPWPRPGPAHAATAGLENGIRLLGSRTGPGGPPRGWRIESVVTSGASRDGPGPGVRTGAGGPEPRPAGTAEAGSRTPEEAGGAGLAVPEAMGAQGWGVTAEVCGAGSGPGATVGVGRAVWGPGVAAFDGSSVLGPGVAAWAGEAVQGPGVAASVGAAVWGPAVKVWGGQAALRLQLIAEAH